MVAESTRIRLSVPEMDCPTCAGKVDRSLKRVEGVVEANLRPTTGGVDIVYDPGLVDDDDLITAIERAGYAVADRSATATSPIGPRTTWRTRRAYLTAIGAMFAIIGGVISLGFPGVDLHLWSAAWWSASVADVAYYAATVVAGVPILRDGAYSLRQRNLDIDLLMSIAILGAVGAAFAFEAAMLAVLYSIAELLERHAMDRARSSLHELLELSPRTATRVTPDGGETVEIDRLVVGDRVAVRPGDRIPVDGTVQEGTAAVDQAPITGESIPVEVAAGDEVFAGTINEAGYLEISVDTPPENSTLARVIELVEDAETGRTDHEQFVDRFAAAYTPVIVVLALLTALGPPLLLGEPLERWFVRGLTLLVIACPCAFVISTPVSVVSGITSAARNGVLIKGGRHLEALADVEVLALDKTGTITTGELTVAEVQALGTDREGVLGRARALESRSEHPIAEAIVTYVAAEGIDAPPVSNFEAIAGRGVAADIAGRRYYAGTPALFETLGVELTEHRYRPDGGRCPTAGPQCAHEECVDLVDDVIPGFQGAGMTVVLVGTEDRLEGVIGVADTVRPEAESAIEAVRAEGVETVVMLTGDNEGTARAIAETVGVDDYHASLLPEEKRAAIADLERDRGPVAMVGDGINDAPALAAATVGIAMGVVGTDTAVEASDVTLMGEDLRRLPYLFRLARTADGVIRQNIVASLAVKAILAIGAPVGIVTVVHAVLFGDMGMSLGVTGNALRLSRMRPSLDTGER